VHDPDAGQHQQQGDQKLVIAEGAGLMSKNFYDQPSNEFLLGSQEVNTYMRMGERGIYPPPFRFQKNVTGQRFLEDKQ